MRIDPLAQITSSRLVIVAGKGGVGKTTVSAVIARAAARRGRNVLVVELESRPTLAQLLGSPVPFGPMPVDLDSEPGETGRIRGLALTPVEALRDYLETHGLSRLGRRLATSGLIDVVATAAPGIDDLVVLGRLKALERAAGPDDLIVVDGPAAGHAITFLTSPAGLARGLPTGPIADQAHEVLAMLGDPSRCQVVLVTTPETTPVGELVDTAFALEEDVGIQLGPVIVNGVDRSGSVPDVENWNDPTADPDEVEAARQMARWWRERQRTEHEAWNRLEASLPLDRAVLPWRPVAGLGPRDIVDLSVELDTGSENFVDDSP